MAQDITIPAQPTQPTQPTPPPDTATPQAAPAMPVAPAQAPAQPQASAQGPISSSPASGASASFTPSAGHGSATAILRGALAGMLGAASRAVRPVVGTPASNGAPATGGALQKIGNVATNFLKAQPAYQERLQQQQTQQREDAKAMDEHQLFLVQHNLAVTNQAHLAFQLNQEEEAAEQSIKDSNAKFESDLLAEGIDPADVKTFEQLQQPGSAKPMVNGQIAPLAGTNAQGKAVLKRYDVDALRGVASTKPITMGADYKVNPDTGKLEAGREVTLPVGTDLYTAYQLHNSETAKGQKAVSDYEQIQSIQKTALDVENKRLTNQKLQTENADTLTQLENKPEMMAGEKAPSVIAMAQARITDPNTSPADKARWQRIQSQATQTQKITESAKANQARISEAVKDGDPNAAAQLLVSGDVSPSQIISNRKPEFATQAFAAAKRLDPTWNAKTADAQFNVAKSPQNVAFFGSSNSLLDKGGTLDQLAALGAQIPQNQLPALNTLEDWQKAATGSGPIAGFAATALGVADDYSKVMGGGAGSDTSREQALKIISAAQSPEQRAAAIQAIRNTVTSQRNARIGNNRVMQSMYGDNTTVPTTGGNNTTQSKTTVPPPAAGMSRLVDGAGNHYDVPAANAAAALRAHPELKRAQ